MYDNCINVNIGLLKQSLFLCSSSFSLFNLFSFPNIHGRQLTFVVQLHKFVSITVLFFV